MASWLSEHVVLGNLAFALLIGYSLYSLLVSAQPQLSLIGYDQARITKGHMEAVCGNEDFYREKLKYDYDLERENIEFVALEYRKDVSSVYPVFRWSCKYEIEQKKDVSKLRPEKRPSGTGAKRYLHSGLSLDEYHCQIYYQQDGLTKATYLDPKNANSWYCANVNPEL